jgi:hypothetical protein
MDTAQQHTLGAAATRRLSCDAVPKRRAVPAFAALLAIVLTLGFSATASATPTISFGASFAPWAYFNEGGIVDAGLTFSGSEYQGRVAPLTSLKLHLPPGTGLSNAGFPTCSEAVLGPGGHGPGDCPEGSLAGPLTSYIASFTAVVPFGNETVAENGVIEPFFGPGGKLYLLLFGHDPVLVEILAEGHIEAGSSGHGPVLAFNLPLDEAEPGKAVSLTSLNLELGATREEPNGTEVSSITVPSECPSGGFAWSVEAGFNEVASPVTASEEADCLQSGSHLRSKSATSLEVSSAAPYEGQPMTFTATVHPSGGATPAGAVTFYEGTVPIRGCENRGLPAGGIITASCEVSYGDPGTHTVHAVYSGDQNYRGSSSAPSTITVQQGSPPPSEEHQAPKEAPHEEPKTSSGPPSNGSSSRSNKISSAAVVASLKSELVPHGAVARIGSLLKHGGVSLSVNALDAGSLSVQWYYLPKGAKLARKAKPVLVASGSITFATAGTKALSLRLTTTGRKLLKHAKRLPLTVRGRFAATDGSSAIATERGSITR